MKRVVIAGAGAGKTRSLLNEVKLVLPDLSEDPYRFCAVITYTKAATEVVRQRLSQHFTIPNNVFIGTTHSFFIRFVIEPYAHLLTLKRKDKTSYIITTSQKSYIDKVELPEKLIDWYERKFPDRDERNIMIKSKTASIISSLCEKGLITYDKILQISSKILEKAKVCDLVAGRLLYVFIDEYQDTSSLQHKLFECIYKRGKTSFYYIGDPLQSIFNFTYSQSQLSMGRSPESFTDRPIMKLLASGDYESRTILENHRSSEEIVSLTNNFTSVVNEIKQISVRGKLNLPVTFIVNTNLSQIITTFDELIEKHSVQPEKNRIYKLLLAYPRDLFSEVKTEHGLEQLDFEIHSIKNQFREISKCLQGVLGLRKNEILEKLPLKSEFEKILEYRNFCFEALEGIKRGNILDLAEYARTELKDRYGYIVSSSGNDNHLNIDMHSSIKSLAKSAKRKDSDKYFSTIHKAKGLEATSVLVCARSKSELNKWLDYEMAEEKDDTYRLGYVAFSRARNFLSVACKEDIEEETYRKLKFLNFEFR